MITPYQRYVMLCRSKGLTPIPSFDFLMFHYLARPTGKPDPFPWNEYLIYRANMLAAGKYPLDWEGYRALCSVQVHETVDTSQWSEELAKEVLKRAMTRATATLETPQRKKKVQNVVKRLFKRVFK